MLLIDRSPDIFSSNASQDGKPKRDASRDRGKKFPLSIFRMRTFAMETRLQPAGSLQAACRLLAGCLQALHAACRLLAGCLQRACSVLAMCFELQRTRSLPCRLPAGTLLAGCLQEACSQAACTLLQAACRKPACRLPARCFLSFSDFPIFHVFCKVFASDSGFVAISVSSAIT